MARSITDEEIGLIKAMLARGQRNVDIQFYFNRQDRPANSGRISQIRNGTYGPEVAQASDAQLDEFLRTFEAAEVGVAVEANAEGRPLSISQRAASRFEQRADGEWYLSDRETTQQECKREFDSRRMNPIIRAIAALANNQGGFVFLGVDNADCKVVGLPDDTFAQTDIVRISDKVKAFLTPTPDFTKQLIHVGGMAVGVVYVEKYSLPPVIVCRDGEGLDDGSVLFRYPGQSAKIKFGDLLAILRERDHVSQWRLLKTAERISEIGIENSLIVDTSAGTLDAGDTRVTIDRELADQLEFIREGEFEEVEGAPTLRLVGDVRAVDPEGEVHERIEGRALTADSVLSAFLHRDRVRSPLDYIRVSALVQRQWLPIFYFAHLSGLSIEDVAAHFEAIAPVYANCKAKALERLAGQRRAFMPATGRVIPVLDRIVAGEFYRLEDEFDDPRVARALQAIPDDFDNFEPVLDLLGRMFLRSEGNSPLKGAIFRASSRLDELAYQPN